MRSLAVGENSSDEKYCVEASSGRPRCKRRAGCAVQGPLSKSRSSCSTMDFAPSTRKQKLRFLVAKAPQDAELSSESSTLPHLNGQTSSVVPPAVVALKPSVVPLVSPSVAPPVVVRSKLRPHPSLRRSWSPRRRPWSPPRCRCPPRSWSCQRRWSRTAEPYAGVPSSSLSPNAPASAVHATSPVAAETVEPALAPTTAKSAGSAFPPRPDAQARATSLKSPAGIMVPGDAIPAAPAVPQGLGPAVRSRPP